MTLIEVLLLLLIAGIAGALGKAIAGFYPGGFLVSIVLGFIGALLGVWIARSMHVPEPLLISVGGTKFPLVWSVVGATLFVAVVGLLRRGR